MAAGLGQHALAGVDEDDGEIGGRGAGRHVAGVLLMARRVGDDEFALVGGEVAIGDIDGDALLALGRQPVDQQREIEIAALGAELPRIALERRELVVEQQLGFIEQPADQRGLAVIDAAAGDEAQQVLAFLRQQIGFDVGRRGSRRRGTSEISLLLLLLHRGRLVVVDDPALAFRGRGDEHFLDDVEKRRGVAVDGAGQGIAAERAEADLAHLLLLAGHERQALVIDHDDLAVADDHRPLLGEVERHDLDAAADGCIARRRARSSSTAGTRGSTRPC